MNQALYAHMNNKRKMKKKNIKKKESTNIAKTGTYNLQGLQWALSTASAIVEGSTGE
jgi:hypothetical protein